MPGAPNAEILLEPLGGQPEAQALERCFERHLDLPGLDLQPDKLQPDRTMAERYQAQRAQATTRSVQVRKVSPGQQRAAPQVERRAI